MNRAILTVIVSFCFYLVIHTTVAAALDKAPGIPASLAPWQEWVLHDKADWSCPTHFNNGTIRRCWWPSRLIIKVGDRGGLFEQQVVVYGTTWVTRHRPRINSVWEVPGGLISMDSDSPSMIVLMEP